MFISAISLNSAQIAALHAARAENRVPEKFLLVQAKQSHFLAFLGTEESVKPGFQGAAFARLYDNGIMEKLELRPEHYSATIERILDEEEAKTETGISWCHYCSGHNLRGTDDCSFPESCKQGQSSPEDDPKNYKAWAGL